MLSQSLAFNQIDIINSTVQAPTLQIPTSDLHHIQYKNNSDIYNHPNNNINNNENSYISSDFTQAKIITDRPYIKNTTTTNNTVFNNLNSFANHDTKFLREENLNIDSLNNPENAIDTQKKLFPTPIIANNNQSPKPNNILPVPEIVANSQHSPKCYSQEKLNDFTRISAPPKIQAQIKLQLEKSGGHG